MTLQISGKIAVDANVILSAVIGGRASHIFIYNSQLIFITTPSVMEEVNEYIPELARRKGLNQAMMERMLAFLDVQIVSNINDEADLIKAWDLMGDRDPDDVPLLALAIHEKCPVWSNDKHFQGVTPLVMVYTTADLLSRD